MDIESKDVLEKIVALEEGGNHIEAQEIRNWLEDNNLLLEDAEEESVDYCHKCQSEACICYETYQELAY